MDDALIIETSVLVDLDRERRLGRPGRAHDALSRHEDRRLFVTATIAGELASGIGMRERDRWIDFLAPFPWLSINEATAWHFGDAWRYLQREGRLIGTNDLWIAATAPAHGVPVLTRNANEYRRVPGLEVVPLG